MVNDNWDNLAPLILNYEDNPESQSISTKIRDYYFSTTGKISMTTLEETVNMFSDRQFFQGKTVLLCYKDKDNH